MENISRKSALAVLMLALSLSNARTVEANDPFSLIIDNVAGVAKAKSDMAQAHADMVKQVGDFVVSSTTSAVDVGRQKVNTVNAAIEAVVDGINTFSLPFQSKETRDTTKLYEEIDDKDEDTVEDLLRNQKKARRQENQQAAKESRRQSDQQAAKKDRRPEGQTAAKKAREQGDRQAASFEKALAVAIDANDLRKDEKVREDRKNSRENPAKRFELPRFALSYETDNIKSRSTARVSQKNTKKPKSVNSLKSSTEFVLGRRMLHSRDDVVSTISPN